MFPAPPVPPALTPERLGDRPLVAALLSSCRFPAADAARRAHCAVSGGADSSALLVLAVAAGLAPTAVHVDHGLRPGGAQEADRVAALAARLGVPFQAVRAEVAPGADLEARARVARHAALPPGTLFGHTAEDQAETVLLRLLRGTGPAGLAAMRPAQHPLLGIRRADTRELCRVLDIDVLEDPSNTDPRFTRNRIRHEVLPLLDEVAARDVTPLLCRLAELSAEQADLLGDLAAAEDATDAARLVALPGPVAAEVIRRWWTRETADPYPPDAAAVARILDVASGGAVACEVGGRWRVRRSRGRLSLTHHPVDGPRAAPCAAPPST
ncbi:MAG: tRNA lysidine(34) synthetase TilS [Microthrixaceae bacterium]